MEDQLHALTHQLLNTARATGHRLTLVVSGDRPWSAATARAVAEASDGPAVWLSDRPIHLSAKPLDTATYLLGGESRLLVYDAWSGFDPDGFGAATGTLRGGGLLILLCPPLDDWPSHPDPQARRITPWPLTADGVTGRFMARLVRVLRAASGVVIVAQAAPDWPAAGGPPPARSPGLTEDGHLVDIRDPTQAATPDQHRAVAAIVHHARGRPHRPLVLTADRGRGKSAALGIAAARLLARPPETPGPRSILVTAPRRAAAEALFRHAALAWAGAHPVGSDLTDGLRMIAFLAPDALCQDHPAADLLLVDEAAGIPAPLLSTLLGHYPRVVFATTVHGYEGTGRGFDLRFRETLDRRTPHWQALTLATPIRWAPSDPLEALVFRSLLLDAAPLSIDKAPSTGPVEVLDRDSLATDDDTLGQVFGLLVLAHYQTRPLDLRLLLDGPGVRVLILRDGGRIAATLIAVEEGGLTDPDLLRDIFDGRRRPRGHLLPLTLSAHGGHLDAPRLRYLRVIRIAVHPGLTRHGLGRRLLRALFREARRDGIDLLGASFGATPGLIGFWDASGYRPVQIGTSRNAASGEHALVMLRPASTMGWTFLSAAGRRLGHRLPVLLAGPLRSLDPTVAAAIIAALRHPLGSSALDLDGDGASDLELGSFTAGHRTLEAVLPALALLAYRTLGPALRAGGLTPAEAALLVATAGQLRPVGDLVRLFGARGREELVANLRRLVGRMRS